MEEGKVNNGKVGSSSEVKLGERWSGKVVSCQLGRSKMEEQSGGGRGPKSQIRDKLNKEIMTLGLEPGGIFRVQ